MLPSRNMTPTMIRTNGPVIERRFLGVTTGLDIAHLARGPIRVVHWRSWRRCGPRRWQHGRPANVPCLRCVALQQLHAANHQQDQWPRPLKTRAMELIQQEQYAQRNHDGRPHDAAHLAAVTRARALSVAQQTPAPRKYPPSKADQDQRPEAVNRELEHSHGMQEENQTQHDQNHRARWNTAAIARRLHRRSRGRNCGISGDWLRDHPRMRCGSEHPFKAEGIRHRLSQLKCVGCLVSVKHQVEEICEEYRNHDGPEVIRHPYQAHEGHHVKKALHELPVVHRSHAGDEPEDGRHARAWQTFHVGGSVEARASRRRSRWKSTGNAFGQTMLTEHRSADIADTGGAQWLSASAAISHCCNIVVRGAVHTSLLVVITDTANGFCGPDASTGWFSSRL